MTLEDEWDAAMAKQPEHSRIRSRIERGESLEERGIRMYGERAEQERADADRFWAGLSDEDRERVWKHGVAICMPDANGSMRSNVARLANDWAESQGMGLTDEEEERIIAATINQENREQEARAEQEARIADLHQQRDFYRDSLRRILGVTRPDGEALIALIEAEWRDLSNLREIVDAHGKVTDRAQDIADEYAGSAPTAGPATNLERIAGELSRLSESCAYIEEHLDIQRTDPDEPLHERLTRVGLVVIETLDARRRADNRTKRWQARARKAEARVAELAMETLAIKRRKGGRR